MGTRKAYLWFEKGFYVEDDILWFVPCNINVLCKFNMVSREVEKIIAFPGMSVESLGAFHVKKCEDYIVTVPAYENSIYLYNTISDEVIAVPLKRKFYPSEKFLACCYWKGFVYFLPRNYECILKLNLRERVLAEIGSQGDNRPICDFVQVRHKIYMVDMSGRIVVFDMDTEIYEQIEICETEHFNAITLYDNKKLIVSNSCGLLYIYDLANGNIDKNQVEQDNIFDGIVCARDSIYLFPKNESEKVTVFHMNTLNTEVIYLDNILTHNEVHGYKGEFFSLPVLEKDIIYVMSLYNRCLYMIDVNSNETTKIYVELDKMDEAQCEYFSDYMQTVGGICESDMPYASIDYFINKSNIKKQNESQTIGKRIFESLKDLL